MRGIKNSWKQHTEKKRKKKNENHLVKLWDSIIRVNSQTIEFWEGLEYAQGIENHFKEIPNLVN
jgi:hypothetical protein